jgi:hypothetical protein
MAGLATALLATLLPVLLHLRAGIRGTALRGAWGWTLAAWIMWLVARGVTWRMLPSSGAAGLVWYAAAIVILAPPIAVLGARRPVSRAWPWFVLLPLVLVFSWPALPVVAMGGTTDGWQLETPVVVGYLLVLVMGLGNYLGLALTLPAILWGAAGLLVVFPLCSATAKWSLAPEVGRTAATLCLVAAGWIADRQAVRSRSRADGTAPAFDRVWRDFRDAFGIVWSRRVQERFNDDAGRIGLNVRLGVAGLETAGGGGNGPRIIDAADHAAALETLRWNLQKFVDSDWIDRRIGGSLSPAAQICSK